MRTCVFARINPQQGLAHFNITLGFGFQARRSLRRSFVHSKNRQVRSSIPAPRLTVTKKGLCGICHSIGHAYHHGREVLAPFASDRASSTGQGSGVRSLHHALRSPKRDCVEFAIQLGMPTITVERSYHHSLATQHCPQALSKIAGTRLVRGGECNRSATSVYHIPIQTSIHIQCTYKGVYMP